MPLIACQLRAISRIVYGELKTSKFNLKGVHCGAMDWSYNTIWFRQISAEKQLDINFKEKENQLDLDGKEYVNTLYMNSKGHALDMLPASNQLLYLDLTWSNIQDLQNIGKFPNLKRLELDYCTKLKSAKGIAELKNSLEILHIHQSKNLVDINEISELKKLTVLRLNACAPIQSLAFIEKFPNLIDLRFVDTKIADGDLTPLIKHPSLRSAGFFDKRNQNYKERQISSILNQKTGEYMEFVYDGKFKTFRHYVPK